MVPAGNVANVAIVAVNAEVSGGHAQWKMCEHVLPPGSAAKIVDDRDIAALPIGS